MFCFTVGAALFAKSCIVYNPIVYFLAVRRFRRDAKFVIFRCVGQQVEEERDSTYMGNGQTLSMATQNEMVINRYQKYQRQDKKQRVIDSNNGSLKSLLKSDLEKQGGMNGNGSQTPESSKTSPKCKTFAFMVNGSRYSLQDGDLNERPNQGKTNPVLVWSNFKEHLINSENQKCNVGDLKFFFSSCL